MRVRHVRRRGHVRMATLAALALTGSALLGGCAVGTEDGVTTTSGGTKADAGETGIPDRDSGSGGEDVGSDGGGTTSYAVDPPGKRRSLLKPDVLITGAETLPEELVDEIRSVDGVTAVLPISLASSSIDGRTLAVAAVDPGEFRRFTPYESWEADFVWERIAGGEVAVDTSVSKKLIGKGDLMVLDNREDSEPVHVGAFAPLVSQAAVTGAKPVIQAVVNERRGEQLGMPEGNALLVSTGEFTPSKLAKTFERILGDTATLQTLALEFDNAAQTAVLTGSSVTDEIGTFSYTNAANGEIDPDPVWVREYIRTEEVPILGTVTCNKGMLPQLRGALTEIVQMGLADKINPDEYAGCYYPRYIGRDPSNGLSLHSWGIAVDLNVPGNLRGTVGEMDRGVVAIFKRWGFAWGGDWSYTDPMHFEMNAVVRPR